MQADTAAVITTYNRPWALARSLPQVLALGCPVLVVDDGSEPAHEQDCERIRREHSCARLHWLRLPSNRGLPCARNIGLCYWLADPAMEWISAFDDDVDVRPDLFARLRPVQDAVRRPLLTGRLAPEHPVVGEATIHGTRVLFHHSAAGTHFHAHRQYWLEVLPIPTPFLGAPEHGRGSDSDWWVGSFSPNSIVKRGAKIACVPGLVRTFATTAQQSTCGNTG
ncbi:MAG: glycosyltransferase, partial [Deltaproteobacteria bacterium]|nr:glycosyltransferase [Deltaproteobacteria bacterium]